MAAVASPSSLERRGTGTPTVRNPISLRLYKTLNSSFDDAATRDALKIVSDYYAIDSRDAETRPDAEDRVNGLEPDTPRPYDEYALTHMASRVRKNLNKDMENKLAEGAQKFLDAFSEVDNKLDALQSNVDDMRARCDGAQAQLDATDIACKVLIEKADKLRDESSAVEARKTVIDIFLRRYTLSEADIGVIISRDINIGPRLFEVIDRTERIMEDCTALLTGEEEDEKAGLDIMAASSSYLQQGYDALLKFCSHSFRQFTRTSSLEVEPLLSEAVRRLTEKRPELFSGCVQILAQTRQSSVLNAFLEALTRGGPSGLPRPIEIHAHDPLRYVGDMLAWVHQAIAEEHEFCDNLFGLRDEKRMVGSVRIFKDDAKGEMVKELMDTSVERLCDPLKIRIRQTLQSQQSGITLYKLSNLLQFYSLTMKRTIGEHALLSRTLQELTKFSYKLTFQALEAYGTRLQREIQEPDDSTSLPVPLLDACQVLRELMVVYDSSLLDDESEDAQMEGFEEVLRAVLNPIISMCQQSTALITVKRLNRDPDVFLLNCLFYLKNVISKFSFVQEASKPLDQEIQRLTEQLETNQFQEVLRDSALAPLIKAIEGQKPDDPLSHIPGCGSNDVSAILAQFAAFLQDVDVSSSRTLSYLSVPHLRALIRHAGLQRLAQAYQQICDAVKQPANRYEFASTLLGSHRPYGQGNLLAQIIGQSSS